MGGEPGEGGTGRQGKATLALRISLAPMSLSLPWTGTVDTVSPSAPSAEHRLLVKNVGVNANVRDAVSQPPNPEVAVRRHPARRTLHTREAGPPHHHLGGNRAEMKLWTPTHVPLSVSPGALGGPVPFYCRTHSCRPWLPPLARPRFNCHQRDTAGIFVSTQILTPPPLSVPGIINQAKFKKSNVSGW